MSTIKEISCRVFGEGFTFGKNGPVEIKENSFMKPWKEVIDVWGDDLKNEIEKYLPSLVQAGINNAPKGAIQDPAGSAIGARGLYGGGASGAIYSTFDLELIPRIKEGSAIFNSTDDLDGMRVLHTHSPTLSGDPDNFEDFMETVRVLANAYLSAMIAFLIQRKELGEHRHLLNLVPVSASIYGGRFRREDLGSFGHMDPSITIVSICLAIGILIKKNYPVPKMCLYYYDKEVYERAKEYLMR